MANSKWKWIVLFIHIISEINANDVFDNVLSDVSPCENVCVNSFPLHTYEKSDHLCYCRRGCRLFSIVEFANDGQHINKTKAVCINSCKEAYAEKTDFDACSIGCNSQVPFAVKRQKAIESMEPSIHLVYPLMYVHSVYSNMVDKISQHMTVSWSFYMQADDGKLIIVKSQPHVYTDYNTDIGLDGSKTANYMDTNLAALDNAATPNVKHSQINPFERDIRDMGDVEFANIFDKQNSQEGSDWLTCITRKTGLSRLVLSLTLFGLAFSVMWLCFITATTATEHKLKSQKLSIYGDLEYLKEMSEQKKLSLVDFHPQEKTDAFSLPIKIKKKKVPTATLR